MGAMLGAGLSLAGGLGGLFGGGNTAQNIQTPNMWQAPGMTDTANNVLSGIANLPGAGEMNFIKSKGIDTTAGLMNNPGAGGALAGAGVAGGMGQLGALGQFGLGQNLQGMGQSMFGPAGQLMNMGFDPQNALYGRTLQQVQDQTRAGLEARGVNSSPYGAGVEGQTLGNFNIDWQNNQLQRALQGAQGGAGLAQAGAGIAGQGAGLAASAPGQYLASSMMPYATGQTIGQNNMSALAGLGGLGQLEQGLGMTPINAQMQYLGIGNQGNAVANQLGQLNLNQANSVFNQNQQFGKNVGAGLQGLFGGGGGGGMGWGGGGGGNQFMPSSSFMNNSWGW